jgi:hypothetical protein
MGCQQLLLNQPDASLLTHARQCILLPRAQRLPAAISLSRSTSQPTPTPWSCAPSPRSELKQLTPRLDRARLCPGRIGGGSSCRWWRSRPVLQAPSMAGHLPWRSMPPCSCVTGALHGFCPPSSSPWSSALPSPRRVPPALSTIYRQQIPNPTSVHPCPRAQSQLGACDALCSSHNSCSRHGCRPHVIPFLAKFRLDHHCQA